VFNSKFKRREKGRTGAMKKRSRLVENIYSVPEEKATLIIKNALEKGVLFWIEGNSWGNRKKVAEDMLEEHGLDSRAIRATQHLLDRDEVRKLVAPIDKAHNFVRRVDVSLPWITKGVYFVYKEKKEQADEFCKACKQEQEVAKVEFLDKLPSLKEAYAKEFPKYYNPAYYPPDYVIFSKFNLRHGYFPITLPGDGKVGILTKEELSREDAKIRARILENGEMTIQAVRKTFLDIMSNLTNILKGGHNKFTDASLDKPKAFLKELKTINVFGDDPFMDLAEKTEKILAGVYAKDLRDDKVYREEMAGILDQVKESFKELPVVRFKRSIEF
jgi:hypothetical protein